MHRISPYGSEIFYLYKKGQKTPSINIDYIFQKNGGVHLFDYKRKKEIPEELKVEPIDEKLSRCKSNWLRHATRMGSRIPKIMLNYRPNRR